MNFDRNTIIGFIAMMVLLFGYIFFTNRQYAALEKEKQRVADSIAKADAAKKKIADSAIAKQSPKDTSKPGQPIMVTPGSQPEQITIVENDLMKVSFTSKGGYPKSVELKKFKRFDGQPVVLGGEGHQLGYPINAATGGSVITSQIDFSGGQIEKSGDDQKIVYRFGDSLRSIEHVFTLKKDDYMIDWALQLKGVNQLFTQSIMNINWDIVTRQQEKDLKYEKGQTNIGYMTDGEYDYESAGTGDTKKLGDKTKWLGIKQQFFNTTVIAGGNFSYVDTEWKVPAEEEDSLQKVMDVKSTLRFNLSATTDVKVPLQLYFGPNDYRILKKYDNQLYSHVQLGGYGIFAFVKYINRWVVMPVFDFFRNYIGSMGIVILLLTFFIRLVISPLTYSSYLSGAKMKVLRPEIEDLKKKYGNDQQAMSMEQMKLFRQAGVNPLGGCIPALLQIPIFFALYSFFNSSIALRGESFLWSSNLAAYDSIANLPFSIPFYGNHVSLFTITATITSFLISLYNMQTTPTQDNPVMKYMIYFFPIMLLFFFNSLPSALTWYYTVSNLVTLGLQFVIQRFIINDAKIHARIQENKKKPVTKTKWQERLEQMQKSNQKLQDMQKKTQGKK